jgi:hypothetical protein
MPYREDECIRPLVRKELKGSMIFKNGRAQLYSHWHSMAAG